MIHKQSLKALLVEISPQGMEKVRTNKGNKELHVFDFDDTIAVTPNANGVVPMRNGEPIFNNRNDKEKFVKFMKDFYGLSDGDFAPMSELGADDGIRWNEGLGSWTAYLTSFPLGNVQAKHDKQYFWGKTSYGKPKPEHDASLPAGSEGLDKNQISLAAIENDPTMQVGIDFSPSNSTSEDVEEIPQTINRIQWANDGGAQTHIMTARGGEGQMYTFDGGTVDVTNAEDMEKYVAKRNAKPTLGTQGVWGGNKGEKIRDLIDSLPADEKPDEIHFYDDQVKNIKRVRAEFADDDENDLFLYGPGHFHGNKVSADVPTEEHLALSERWARIAGLIK